MKNKKLFAILTLVCFMFTLMPVAAFAAPGLADAQDSYVYVDDTDVDVKEAVEVTIDAKKAANYVVSTDKVYVWFEQKANVPSTALGTLDATGNFSVVSNGVYEVTLDADKTKTIEVAFDKAGTYEVHAAFADPTPSSGTWADAIAEIADYELQTEAGYDVVTVSADAAKTSDYVIEYNGSYYEDGDTINAVLSAGFEANGIDVETITFTVYEKGNGTGNALTGPAAGADVVYAYDVDVDATSKVVVNDVEAKRNGKVSFEVTVEKAGTHKVYVEIGSFNVTFKIDANEGEAEEIEVEYVAANPVNIEGSWNVANGNLKNQLRFNIYDENGNKLTGPNYDNITDIYALGAVAMSGFDKAGDDDTNYVSIVEQPADSNIKNADLSLVWSAEKGAWTILIDKAFEEEGEYTFKVALNDGTSVKASLTLKESGDYVALTIAYATETVQLGATIAPTAVNWVDANKVTTPATGVEFTASGAAVQNVVGNTITVKDDEKYIGSKIEVAVVDEDNNLIATKTLTVAAEAKELVFEVPAVPVDTTRTIGVKLVDENGKTVGLNSTTYSAYVVVLEKPADSDVTATVVNEKPNKGTFDINFFADTVGIVKLQAVLKATVDNVVRYYTGIVEIPVGAAGVEDVVVLSIGSNELIKNDTIVEIPAPAMIKEARTFVPFRAVGEAFGAEVEWDAATQSVTAELDGVTVVLTIGSPVYTVNGVEKTADVAPFIAGDGYTMVPVRLIAEAFGYVVEFTTNPNGTVADVLFRG